MNCRHCAKALTHTFLDLGFAPPSNAYLTKDQLSLPEKYYPLKIMICDECWLAQTLDYAQADEFFSADYAYFSSFSTSWLAHAKAYTQMMVDRFGFDEKSTVIEIASNDGYLLQYFKELGIPVLGIEPTANTAAAAKEKGIDSLIDFFSIRVANSLIEQGTKASLLLGNNVLAHVPDINDFVGGLKILLAEDGVVTFEFPHFLQLIDKNQFDTVYHEHFSYLSLIAVREIFDKQGLDIFDVEELSTHGGSLRIFAKHPTSKIASLSKNVQKILEKEISFGLDNITTYQTYQEKAEKVKNEFISFLLKVKSENKKVIGYGAAAKGNTLLNYSEVKGTDLISYVVDASPFKQNKFLPGSRIPIFSSDKIKVDRPDYIIIFPWNLKEEISNELSYTKEFGAKFVVAIPELIIF